MKKLISFLLIVSTALCLVTACAQTLPEETKPAFAYTGKSVAIIGDSIIYGISLENLTNQYWLHLK